MVDVEMDPGVLPPCVSTFASIATWRLRMKLNGKIWMLLALPFMGMIGCKSMSTDCGCSSGMSSFSSGSSWTAWSPKWGWGESTACSTCETSTVVASSKTQSSEGKIVEGKVVEAKPANKSNSNKIVVPDEVRKPLPSRLD